MTLRTRLILSVILTGAVAGCSAPPADEKNEKLPPVNPKAASLKEGFSTMDRLVEAAKKEGTLTVIGLPRDWVGYGEIIETFAEKYGIKVQELEPGANSSREIEVAAQAAARAKDDPKATAPDVFDLSLEVAVANARRLAPYRVQTWQDIPDNLKDGDGAWYAAYGGYISIGYDSRKVPAPASFADLLKPGYTVALPGNPLRAAAAFNGVMAASLSSSSGPSGVARASAERGVQFFARLKHAGNLVSPRKSPTAVIDWDYLNTERAAKSDGAWKVTIPSGAVLGSYYVQAINKAAPHPAAARLWQEFLYSDEGQNLFLRGYARPARMEALEMRRAIDREAAARLAPLPATKPVLLTISESDTAKTHLQKTWPKRIG